MSPEEKIPLLSQLHEQELREERLKITVAEAQNKVAEAQNKVTEEQKKVAEAQKKLAEQRLTYTTTRLFKLRGKLHVRGVIEDQELEFKMVGGLGNVRDRRKLWTEALKLPEYSRLLGRMRQFVNVSKNDRANDYVVISEIAEQMAIVHSQLSEKLHSRHSADDVVYINASVFGQRNAHLVKCVVDNLYVICEIVNDDGLPDSWDKLTEDEGS